MNILFLTFYFEPDLCACTFRNTPLFREIVGRLGKDDYVHVVTTQPNRYKTFEAKALPEEVGENYRISRVQIPKHSSGMLDQAKSFTVFYRKAFELVKGEQFDLVYASSSRLFTAFLGRRMANKFKAPLYLDIRDIFVDTMKDIFKDKKYIQIPAILLLKRIESYTFKNATHINLISGGFKGYFEKYRNPPKTYFTNGMDEQFAEAGKYHSEEPTKPYIITYAGNIGMGQGLEKVVPQAAKRLGHDYIFRIIGDGGTRSRLEDKIKELGVTNVELLKPVPRNELIDYYRKSTFLFFHLNDLEAFKKVIPSKMFEYGAFDKPIIAGVAGYAREFVKKHIPNHILFAPTDVDDFVRQMQSYAIRFEPREELRKDFSRAGIDKAMADSILACAGRMV